MPLSAIGLNCSLKHSCGEPSSTEGMIALIGDALASYGVTCKDIIRAADLNILPGVRTDEGSGDDWPALRRKILETDILIFGTPIWLGQPSSIAKRILERMDAFFAEVDEMGRTPATGKVAVTAIVGNEDGAHHVTAELFQALNDTGWTLPSMASCYWVGEAMRKKDFRDLAGTPRNVELLARGVASNAAHLASLLTESIYPGRDAN